MLFAAPLLLCSSCGIEDVEAEDGAIVFELYDTEGNLIEGLQSMRFGTTATYTLKSAFVTYTVATPPTGWKCTVIPSSRSCSVTAPPQPPTWEPRPAATWSSKYSLRPAARRPIRSP